jgi:hypothetical protein
VASALFGSLIFVILLNNDTPKDRLLIREIENLKLNYAVLNKKMNQLDNVIEAIEDRDNNLYRTYFTPLHIKEERKSGLNRTMPTYKDITIHILNTTKG